MNTQLTKKDIEYNTNLLIEANKNDDVEAVQRLIPVSDPKADNSHALRWAAFYGHTEIVKLLISVSDPKANDSEALRMAARNGHIECVKLLLPVSDPKALESGALRDTAANGHTEIVKLLIPVSNPQDCDNLALRWAAGQGHIECVKLLIPVSDYTQILQWMTPFNRKTILFQQFIEEYEVQQQQERLNTTLAKTIDKANSSVKRKM